MAKQYSPSQRIGDEGHTFAARIVTALGLTWHDRRVDHGIDGEIELIDPATRQPLNRLVLVQSKASNSPFPGESDTGFHFLVSNDDIAYWTKRYDAAYEHMLELADTLAAGIVERFPERFGA